MQPSLSCLLGFAILLSVNVVVELTSGGANDGGMIASNPPLLPIVPKAAPALPLLNKDRQKLVDAILNRPLFAATRRPFAVLAVPASLSASLPRLAGILVSGHSRSAIFAVGDQGRSLVVQEGARVGDYTVRSIKAGQVTLSSSGASQVLRPTFDARPQTAASGPAAAELATKKTAPVAVASDIMQSLLSLPEGITSGAMQTTLSQDQGGHR